MIDLKKIENEINSLKDDLYEKQQEYKKAKENNLKEQYGKDFGCDTCAYSCCIFIGDPHNSCYQGNCVLCEDYCDKYMPSNDLSEYIRKHHHYDDNMLDSLNDLFDVSDIMTKPEFHKTALEVLMLVDKN
jgi:hypothetical protein